MIYVDGEGNVRLEKSDSTQELASIVSTPEARQNLLDILERQIDCDSATACMSITIIYV